MVSPLKRLIRTFIVAFAVIILYLLIDGKINAIYLATENMFTDLQWTEEILEPQLSVYSEKFAKSKGFNNIAIDHKEVLQSLDSVISSTIKAYEMEDTKVFMLIGTDSLQYRIDFNDGQLPTVKPITELETGLVDQQNYTESQARIFVQLEGNGSKEFVGLFSPVKRIGSNKILYAIYTPAQSWFQIIKKELFTNALVIAIVIVLTVFFTIRSVNKIMKSEEEIKNELHHTNKELNKKNLEITDSIKYAKSLQDAILLNEKEVKKLLPASFIYYQPKDIVAGDFYWVLEEENRIYFAAADCTGHGVPGAMVSMICANALNRVASEFNQLNPSEILGKVRNEVIKSFKAENNVKDGMDISLLIYDKSTHLLQWAAAYNPLWVINKYSGEFTEYKGDKQPIAAFSEIKPFTNHQIDIKNGDVFYLFSDGFADQFGGPKNKKFRYKPMQELLKSISTLPFDEQKKELERVFHNWKGHYEQIDDVLVMGVEFI